MQWRCNRVKVDAVDVIGLMKTECRLQNRTIFFTFLSFFLNFFSWYFIYFSFRLMWLYLFWDFPNFIFIFQILYNLNSQSIWKIEQSFLPPTNTSLNKTHYIVHRWTCRKSLVFLRHLGNFLTLGKLTSFDIAANLQSYLRRLDYTFSKELFGSIAT